MPVLGLWRSASFFKGKKEFRETEQRAVRLRGNPALDAYGEQQVGQL